MDAGEVAQAVFYTSKIIRIGLLIGVFETLRRLVPSWGRSTQKHTRLESADCR